MAVVIFRGEDPTLTLTATTDGSTGFSLTGATLETRFQKKTLGQELIITDSPHTIDADQSANPGKFTLDLTAAETETLKLGDNLKVITSATISNAVTKFDIVIEVKAGNTIEVR